MKTLLKTTCLCFILFFNKATAQNSLPVLRLPQQTKDSIHLRPYMAVYVDSTNQSTIQNIKYQHFIKLSALQVASVMSTGFNYWYRFDVENAGVDTVKLSLNFMEIFSLTAYTFQEEWLLDSVTVGKLVRPHPQYEQKNYPSNRTVLLYFPPQKQVTVWLKAKKSWCHIPEQPVLSPPSVEASFHYKTLLGVYAWNFTFLGVLLFMMIHALTHYFLQKQSTFLFYFLYILSHFAFYWWVFEYQDHLLTNIPIFLFDYAYRTPLGSCWGVFYILFLDSFFEAKQKMPQLHRWLRISMTTFLLLLLIDCILVHSAVESEQFTGWFKRFLNLSGGILVIYMLWYLRKSNLVKYILIGTFLFAVGSAYTRFLPDSSFYWENGLIGQQIGILLELIFFSIGLAYKSRLDTIEKERLAAANQQLSFQNTITTLEKERLTFEIAQRETEIRTEIALDIHDKVGAELSKMSLAAQSDSFSTEANAVYLKERIHYYGNEARLLASKMREIIFAIDPDYNNFEDMQAYFREQAREFWAHLNVEAVYDFDSEINVENTFISTNLKRHLLPIYTEAQNNVAKYAQTKKIFLTFKLTTPEHYLLEIKDEGVGFDINKVNHEHCKTKGISGIKHRSMKINAVCSINSVLGKGTIIHIVGHVKQ